MASWSEIEAAAPELAARARALLDAHVNKTLATLRRDGGPRISGTEIMFHDGELWFGSMPGALKARDLLRDPRFALHSGSDDPPAWPGDAKLAGRAVDERDPERRAAVFASRTPEEGEPEDPDFSDSHLFRADIDELSVVGLNEARDRLVIDLWTAAGGLRHIERA
jgi:hypothetical protein